MVAAAGLFAAQGYQATTIAAIARAAGVSGETVKTTASKPELLLAAFEVTFSGTEAAGTLTDTEIGAGVLALPDDVFLDEVIGQVATANARGHALWTVVLGAALSDPLVDAALQRILENRRSDYARLTAELIRRGIAQPLDDQDAAAAAISFLLSPESYQQLVAQSGWTEERYESWLRGAVRAELSAQARID